MHRWIGMALSIHEYDHCTELSQTTRRHLAHCDTQVLGEICERNGSHEWTFSSLKTPWSEALCRSTVMTGSPVTSKANSPDGAAPKDSHDGQPSRKIVPFSAQAP